MKVKQVFISLIIFLFFSTSIYAISADTIIEKVKESQNQIKDFQAQYVQTVESFIFGQDIKEEKGYYFKKGMSFRKEITSPENKIIINTDSFYYEKDLKTNKVTKKVFDKKEQNTAFSAITPEEAIEQFDFDLINETEKEYTLEGKSQSQKLTIYIDKQAFVANKMIIYVNDKPSVTVNLSYDTISGQKVLKKTSTTINLALQENEYKIQTELEYLKIKINQGLSDRLFSY